MKCVDYELPASPNGIAKKFEHSKPLFGQTDLVELMLLCEPGQEAQTNRAVLRSLIVPQRPICSDFSAYLARTGEKTDTLHL